MIPGYADPVTRLLRAYDQRVETLKEAVEELLKNKGCSCGGWKCARCKLAIKEARQAIRASGRPRPG